MLEINDLDAQVIKTYESLANTKLGDNIQWNRQHILWDRLTILTKRSLNSNSMPKQLAKMDVIMNAGFDLRLIRNLLDKSLKCTKLMSNIFSANGNIHQFSAEELADYRTVGKTVTLNAVEMINKSNPMVFVKGINSLMIVDISDKTLRFKCLCDIAVDSITNNTIGMKI